MDMRQIQNSRVKKYSKNIDFNKPVINFDIETLRLMASLVISDNPIVNRKVISSVSNLFNSINIDNFKNEPEKMKYIDVILKGSNARLSSGTNNTHIILSMIRGGVISYSNTDDDYSDIFRNLLHLNNEELKFVNSTVESCLTYINIADTAPRFIELLSDIEQNKTNSKIHNLIDDFNDLVSEYINKVRNSKGHMGEDIGFRISPSNIDASIDDYLSKNDKLSEKIQCGVQALNELVGGGFERERCYMFTGIAGVGKSLVCLNLLLQFMKYNKNIKTMDSSKKPCMVYLTQENSTYETIQRMLSILGCKDPTKTSKSEIMSLLGGMLNEDNEPDIELVVVYKENSAYTTDLLYDIYEDLYQEGYEVAVLIQDHIKRLRSAVYKGSEPRLELGAIVNEFKAFATLKKCVVITVSHLNRSADTKMTESISKGLDDPLKNVGRDAIGESYLMIDNVDVCVYMHKTIDINNQEVMCFSRIKERVKCPLNKYIVHPMNGTELISDIGGKSLSRLSVNPDSVQNSFSTNIGKDNNIHDMIGKYDSNLGRNIKESDIVKKGNTKLVTLNDIFNNTNKDNSVNIINISNNNKNTGMKSMPLYKSRDEIMKMK